MKRDDDIILARVSTSVAKNRVTNVEDETTDFLLFQIKKIQLSSFPLIPLIPSVPFKNGGLFNRATTSQIPISH